MKAKIIIISIFSLSIISSFGQGTADLLRLSQINYSMGTARSAAMAGAFVSLGADPSSMSINPAGLAMYKCDEFSISPALQFGNSKSTYNNLTSSNDKTSKFSIQNFGVILGHLGDFDNKITIGIGYNRLADYYSNGYVYGTADNTSMGQMFMETLYGIPASDIGSPVGNEYQAFYKYVPSLWNGIMAYQAGLVNPTWEGDTYNMAGLFDYQYGDIQHPQTYLKTEGALHEYTLSGAYNIKNKLYIGLSLSLQNMIYDETYHYGEVMNMDNYGTLDNFTLKQTLDQNGVGFNFKIGATLNLNNVRIGLAYHSPTWGNFREESYSNMTVYDFSMSGYGFSDTPLLRNSYRYTTPSHFLAGISGTIAQRVIISADYEYVGYGSMAYRTDLDLVGYRAPVNAGAIDNLQNVSDYNDGYRIHVNELVKDTYKGAHNFRCAVEVRPIEQLFLRAGYAYYGSMYKDSFLDDYGKFHQFSGGIGYRSNFFFIDLAYVRTESKQLPYQFFRYIAEDGYTVESSGIANVSRNRNSIILTLGFRLFDR